MGFRCPLGFYLGREEEWLFFSISAIIIILVNFCINIFLSESKLNVFPENCYILLRYGILSIMDKVMKKLVQPNLLPIVKHGINSSPAELIWELKIFLNENFEYNNHFFIFRYIFIGRGLEINSWL